MHSMGIIIMDQTTLQNDDHDDHRSFSSQKSLQSVPSLTSDHQHHHRRHYFCLVNTFTAHSASVSSVAVSGDTLFTGSSDREIGSWSTTAAVTNNFTLAAGNGAVKSLVASGERLFSAHQDHKIRVWKNNIVHNNNNRCSSYARVATLPTLGDRAAKMIVPGNRVAVRRHKKSTWVHHVDAVSALALSADASLLYSVSWDRSLKVWRTADFRCLESVRDAHDDAINAVVASPDGHVYTGSADKKIKVWVNTTNDTTTEHCLVASLERHRSGINALAMSRDGEVLYSGASDRSIVVWGKGVNGGEGIDGGGLEMVVLGALRGHTKAILCLSVVNDLVISGSADKTVRVWRGVERSYSCLAVFQGHTGPVKCLTAVIDRHSHDHDHGHDDDESYLIYSGGLDCEVKVWQIIVPNLL